jgi:precorrin-8X/cobalt-precorrin-8 methylmutase
MTRAVHPIEAESYRILRERLDLAHLEPLSRAVAERVCHAAADVSLAPGLVLQEEALAAGRAALLAGAPVVCDARMAAAGITAREALVPLGDPRVPELAAAEGLTRTAAAMRLAAADVGPGAIWVIGNAPTALFELIANPPEAPALIVGLPVGFVGAADAKAALAASDLPHATNVGERGGSSMAAAAVNALLYFREDA